MESFGADIDKPDKGHLVFVCFAKATVLWVVLYKA